MRDELCESYYISLDMIICDRSKSVLLNQSINQSINLSVHSTAPVRTRRTWHVHNQYSNTRVRELSTSTRVRVRVVPIIIIIIIK